MYDASLLDVPNRRDAAADGGGYARGSGGAGAPEVQAGVGDDAAEGGGDAGLPPDDAGSAGDSGKDATSAGKGASGMGGAGQGSAGHGGAGQGGAGQGGAGQGGAGHGSGGQGGAGQGGGAGSGTCVASASEDCCPDDPNKQAPGVCGCGVADVDTDLDGAPDCMDPAPYGWQRALTLDGTQIAGDLTDFPLLVRLSDAHLQSNAAADGGDIYFTAADQRTVLDFELESYLPASGTLVGWVRLPSMSAASDMLLYLGYSAGKTGRSNANGVWSGYKHVWHLAQDPSLGRNAMLDSRGSAPGTAQGSMSSSALVPAVAGSGLQFDGVDDQVTFVNDISGNGASTLSGWVKQAADSGDNGSSIISFGSGSLDRARFLLSLADQQKIKVGFYGNDQLTSTILPQNTWKYVTWVWTGSQSTVYVDGSAVLGPVQHTNANTSGSTGSIGGSTFGYDFFLTGQLDEVRAAAAVRSSAWIATEYNNQRPGSTFIKQVGAAQAAPTH